jgi:hypothetical protein
MKNAGIVAGAAAGKTVSLKDVFTPAYKSASGYTYKVRVSNGGTQQYNALHLATLTSRTEATTGTITAASRLNPGADTLINTYDVWKFVITTAKQSPLLKRIDIEFPSAIQWVDQTCKLLKTNGIKDESAGSTISCKLECPNPDSGCTKRVVATNFGDSDYTNTMEM